MNGVAANSFLSGKVGILGVGATRAGVHPGITGEQLAIRAFKSALDDSGISKNRIDAVVGGVLNGSGIDPERFSARIGLNPKITNALAYPSSAFTVHHAAFMIASGMCDVVLCVCARNPPGANEAISGPSVWDPAHGLINANAVAALGASQHMARYGTTEEAFGRVVLAERAYAQMNPDAAHREPLTLEDYFAREYLFWPLRTLDVAVTHAAGVAVLLGSREAARDCAKKPVYIYGYGRRQAVRRMENDDHLMCNPMKEVATQVFGSAGCNPSDIDALFIYDATSAIVLQSLENYGYCPIGESDHFVKAGNIDPGGALAVNTHGGHLSGGYLFGWTHHVELVRQLRGECGPRQVKGARTAQFTTTGRFREDFGSSIFATE
jgi:acetyl-CoA acetyltransferase